MEDNIQTIIMSLVAIVIFFIFPTYVAYEKKDDLSYSLALKYTQTFVDSVRSKGYVSNDMYNGYLSDLAKTGNNYDVNLEHRRKKAEPVTNYFQNVGGQDKLIDFRNQESRALGDEKNFDESARYSIVENTYRMDEEVISGMQVLAVMNKEDFYQMNVGDEFTVVLKNTNTTFATIFYNLITIGGSDTNTRIYVNYGGSVTNETWTKVKDYSKSVYDHPISPSGDIYEVLKDADATTSPNDIFDIGHNRVEGDMAKTYEKDFVIEFRALPKDTTELPIEGYQATRATATTKTYNCLVKALSSNVNTKAELGITVGVNGLAITLDALNYYCSILTYNQPILTYTSFKIVVKNNIPTLYKDGVNVAEGIAPPYISGSLNSGSPIYVRAVVGQGPVSNQQYIGNAKDFKFYSITM